MDARSSAAALAQQAELVSDDMKGFKLALGSAYYKCALYRIDGHRGDSCRPGFVETSVGEPAGEAGLPQTEEVSAGPPDGFGVIGELDRDRRDRTAGYPAGGFEQSPDLGDLSSDDSGRGGGAVSRAVDLVEDVTGHEVYDLPCDFFLPAREVEGDRASWGL